MDHVDGDQTVLRIACIEFQHGIEVAEAHIVSAAGNFADGVGAAETSVNAYVQACLIVVATFLCEKEGPLWSLEGEIKCKANRGSLGSGYSPQCGSQDSGDCLQQLAVHNNSLNYVPSQISRCA